MKIRFRAAMAVAASAALLAACSSAEPSGDAGSEAPASDAGTTEMTGDWPDLGGTTVNVAASWSGTEQENFQKVLAGFEEATGATVQYTSFGDKAADYLGTQIAGGSAPDVALIAQPGLLKQFVADGSIKPLSDDTLATVKENYAQTWVDLSSVDGKDYGVWLKASNKSTIWYNTSLYDAAGVTPPQTWDDFVAALQTLSDSGVAGISVGADVGWPLTDWFENAYLRIAGAEKYDQLTNHEIPWTDDSVKQTLEALAQVWGNPALVEEGGAQRAFVDTVTEVFGDSPKVATVYEGDFLAANIAETGAAVGTDALYYPWPSMNGSAPAVMGSGDVAIAFNDGEAAQALLKYLATPEAANTWIALGGFTSPNQNSDLSLYPDDVSRQIAQDLVNAETFRFDMSDLTPSAFGGTQGQGFWQEMINFYEDPADVQGAMDALEAAAASAYEG